MHIGNIIRYYREKLGLTQEELAFNICSPTYLSQIETGKSSANKDIVILIGNKLKVDLIKELETDKKLNKKILEWYKSILNNDKDKIETLYSELKKEIRFDNIEVKIDYLLIELRYFLYHFKLQKASTSLKHLESIKIIFNQQQFYFFTQFYGIFLIRSRMAKEAIEYFENSLSIGEKLNIYEPILYYQLSIAYSQTQKIIKSINYALEALKLYSKAHKYHSIIKCNMLLGINYSKLKEYDLSEKYFKDVLQAIPMSKGIDEGHIKGKLYHNLGYINYLQQNFSTSITYLEKSLSYRNNDLEKLRTFYIIAQSLYLTNQHQKSHLLLSEALLIANKHKEWEFYYKIKVFLCENDKNCNRNDLIFFLESDVIPYFEKYGDQSELLQMIRKLGDLYFKESRYKQAAILYKKVNSLKEV